MRDVYACALLAYVGGMKTADALMSRKHQSQPHPSTTSRIVAAHMHWVYAQIIRAEKQFGADNRVVEFERLKFATRLRQLEQNFETDKNYIFIAMDTAEEWQRLVVLLNALLGWAGIPTLTEEQLLAF